MDTPLGRHAKRGFVLAIVLGVLSIVYCLAMPIPGLISLVMYFVVAWGIRQRRPGAAWLSGVQALVPIPFIAVALFDPSRAAMRVSFVVAVLLSLLIGWLLLRAGQDLRHDPNRRGPDWPWAALPLASLFFWCCLGAFTMPSSSMQNTILTGDCFLVNRASTQLGRDPQRDEIVAFRYPLNHAEDYIKRVVGIPGDRLRLQHKQLYRNGALLPEPYAIHSSTFEDPYRDNFPAASNVPMPEPAARMLQESVANGEVTVPAGKYFLMGDNRDDSSDSRYWGFVDRSEIVGRPIVIYASYDLKQSTDTRSILNTRWDRLLKLL